MLKLNPDPTFEAPAKVTIPGQNKTGTLKMVFKYRDRDQMDEWFKYSNEAAKNKVSNAEIFKSFVEGWDWPDVDFNDENIETFLKKYPAAGIEIALAYQRLIFESRVKN